MKNKANTHEEKLDISVHQLLGKQSVRATFRLSDQLIDLLKVAATHLDVQQKSLIDELVQNREVLDQVANGFKDVKQKTMDRRQKTFVLSRHSLDLLDDISEKYNLSRDYLVELCISRLIPFVDAEQEKHHQRRKLIKALEEHLEGGRKILENADKMLHSEDRFRVKLEKIIAGSERDLKELRNLVKEKQTLLY